VEKQKEKLYFTQTTKQATGSSFSQIIGYLITFVSSLTFARLLGASNLGLYHMADTTIALFGLLVVFGLTNTPIRFIPEFKVVSGSAKVVSFIRYILFRTFFFSLIGIIALLILSSYITEIIFKEPELSKLLLWMSPCVLLLTLENLSIEILKSFKKASWGIFVRAIIEKASKLSIFVILSIVFSPELYVLVIATYIMYLSGVIFPSKQIGSFVFNTKDKIALTSQEKRKIVKFSLFVFLMSLSGFLSTQINTLILGAYSNSSEVGIYGIANRLAILVAIPLMAFNSIFPANISELYAQNDIKTLNKLYKRFTWITLFLSLIPFAFFTIYPKEILAIFGKDFPAGKTGLQILAISQLVNVSVGSAGFILTMTGKEKWEFFNQITLAITNVILAIVLAKQYGILGVAIATAVSVAVMNIMRLIEAHSIYGLSPYDKSYLKLFVSGSITILVLSGLSYILPSNIFLRVSVAGIVSVTCMVGIAMILGIGEMEKQLIEEIFQKVKR